LRANCGTTAVASFTADGSTGKQTLVCGGC
jgi:hypothetical protein